MIIGRSSRLTHFLEWRDYKIVFKRYYTTWQHSANLNLDMPRSTSHAVWKKKTTSWSCWTWSTTSWRFSIGTLGTCASWTWSSTSTRPTSSLRSWSSAGTSSSRARSRCSRRFRRMTHSWTSTSSRTRDRTRDRANPAVIHQQVRNSETRWLCDCEWLWK